MSVDGSRQNLPVEGEKLCVNGNKKKLFSDKNKTKKLHIEGKK